MIIFYIKKTGEIIGTVSGRVHSEDVLKNVMTVPSGYKKGEIGKYVVPFKKNFEMVEEPIVEQRVVNKKTMKVGEVVVGKRMVKRFLDMTPDVPFAKLITDIESGKEDIYKYKIDLKTKRLVKK